MRNKVIGVLALAAGTCACVWAADWPSAAGSPQREGYVVGEVAVTKDTFVDKKVELLYKTKIPTQARGLSGMTAPIILGQLIGWQGFKEPMFLGGSNDTLYSVDAPTGQPYFTTKLDLSEKVAAPAPTVACPGGLTAGLAMAGSSSRAGRGFGGGRGAPGPGPQRPRGPAVFFGISSDGYIHAARQQDGDAKYIAPAKFIPANSNATSINVSSDMIYVATINDCGGPNALYAADYTQPQSPRMPGEPVLSPSSFKVTTFLTNGSGFSGSGGTAIGNTATAPAGQAAPAPTVYGQVAEGKGDVAGTYNDTVLALDPATLAVKDFFTPSGKLPAIKKGIESAGVTPVVFPMGGKDIIVAGSRDGRLYVLDSASLGGSDHHTPLSMTEPIVAPDTDFDGNGIWGTFSTWADTAHGNARWIYAAVRGAVTLKGLTANGPAPAGSIVAFKMESVDGKPTLTPQWVSSDLISPTAPITAGGLVYTLSTGLNPRVAKAGGTPYTVAEVEKMSKPAVLHVFDGASGKELFTGSAATTFAHSGLAFANGRIYFTTHDNTLFAYGVPFLR